MANPRCQLFPLSLSTCASSPRIYIYNMHVSACKLGFTQLEVRRVSNLRTTMRVVSKNGGLDGEWRDMCEEV